MFFFQVFMAMFVKKDEEIVILIWKKNVIQYL